MTREEFRIALAKHGLTVNTFFFFCDIWNQLSASDRYELLKQELTNDEIEEPTP